MAYKNEGGKNMSVNQVLGVCTHESSIDNKMGKTTDFEGTANSLPVTSPVGSGVPTTKITKTK